MLFAKCYIQNDNNPRIGGNTLKSLNTRQSSIQLMNKKIPNTNCSRKTPSQFCQKIKNLGKKNENCTDHILFCDNSHFIYIQPVKCEVSVFTISFVNHSTKVCSQ